jgi:hypothetical protein
VEHALAADFEVHGDAAAVARIAPEWFAVEILRDVAQLIPGLRNREVVRILILERLHVRGIGQKIAPVVQYLTVTIVWHDVLLPIVHPERLNGRQFVFGLELRELAALVRVHIVVREQKVSGDELTKPPHADHRRVELVRAVGLVVEELRERLGDGIFDDVHLRAGGRFKLGPHFLPGNLH